jgi:hypothetical protein
MVAEAEQFASEDEAQRKRIESLNSLSSFVYGLKTQLGDQEGLGGKVSDEDKKTILAAVKDTTDWIDENGATAGVEDLEEKLAGALSFPFLLPFLGQPLMLLSSHRDPDDREPHHVQVVREQRSARRVVGRRFRDGSR